VTNRRTLNSVPSAFPSSNIAEEQNRKCATPEDLPIALIDDPDAADIMRALLVDSE
jgi:hypothetical protein